MFKKISAAIAAVKSPSVAATVVLALGWTNFAQADTLAYWDLSGSLNADGISSCSATSHSQAIFSAIIERPSSLGKPASNVVGFGGKGFIDTSFEDAVRSNRFIDVSFTVSANYLASPMTLNYKYTSTSSSGPKKLKWVCLTNNIEYTAFDEGILKQGSSAVTTNLSLSALGEFAPGTDVTLRLYAWEGSTGNFVFKNSMSIEGTFRHAPSDNFGMEPIEDKIISFGETPMMTEQLEVFGENGEDVTFSISATDKTGSAFMGNFGIENGVFSYTPAKTDAILSPITFTITADTASQEPVSQSFDVTVNVIPPAIGEIARQECYAGDTNTVELVISGDYAEDGELVSTNATCLTPGVTGDFSSIIGDGAFWYAPSVEDIAIANENYGVIGFMIVLTVGDLAATNVFTVAVSKRPDFLEDFEVDKAHSGFFNPTETFNGTAAAWRGTNFNVNTFSGDYGRGTKTAKFRESGYIEMTTAKPNGAGAVSFWHKFASSANKNAEGSYIVEISNNGGSSWKSIGYQVVVSTNLEKTIFSGVNLGGNVQLRFTYTGTPAGENKAAAVLDDIEISDYYGSAEIDPAIGEIPDQTIHADETCGVEIVFYGNEGLTKSVECITPGVTGEYGFDTATGTFSYAPALSDLALNGGVISFIAYLKDEDVEKAARSFTVTLLPPEAKWLELRANSMVKENFDLIGGDADAELPAPWRVAHTNSLFGTNFLSYGEAKRITDRRATSAGGEISISYAGIYNVGTNDEDRAVGFLSSNGSSSQYKTCALMVPVKNVGTSALGSLYVRYTVEKWRRGHGKTLALCFSTNGVSWTMAGGKLKTETSEDTKEEDGKTKTDTAVLEMGADPTLDTLSEKLTLEEPLAAGETIYLGWFYMSNETNCGSAQALAIDDVRISAGNPDMTAVIMK